MAMEDFENKLLKTIGDGCWHVKNNNNNLVDSNVTSTQIYRDELLFEKEQAHIKQRETAAAALVVATATTNTATKKLCGSAVGVSGGSVVVDVIAKGGKQIASTMTVTATTTTATAAVTPTYMCRIEDEGGGGGDNSICTAGSVGIGFAGALAAGIEKNDKQPQKQQNGAATPAFSYIPAVTTTTAHSVITTATTTALSNMVALPSLNCDIDTFGMAAAAAAFSPTDAAAAAIGLGAGGISSNRTSMNNSTENLSYSSDNYYPDDLILLDDDDVEAEEISLNSDDCVYAYRGDGADFELAALDANLGRGGALDGIGLGAADDETDFLEMDFEPDPLSEAEFASLNAAGGVDHANLFLMQRDFSQLSGRHSANISLQVTPTQRQHFSSPIDDLPPQEALQTQAQRLNKNFARISLHLDQIKDNSADDANDGEDELLKKRLSGGLDTHHLDSQLSQTAHSLPNTLYTSFSREHSTPVVAAASSTVSTTSEKSPSKVTGAKPKRLSTFSTSSSVSSKNSSKSRNSLRSAFAPTGHGNSASFDERCVSCTDFRAAGNGVNIGGMGDIDCAPMLAAAAAAVVAATAMAAVNNACNTDLSTNEETCLDCLEKEFLANTIGKPIDLSSCPKCAHKRSSSISLYTRADQTRCRSGSPSYFLELRDECLFSASNMPTPRKRSNEWPVPAPVPAAASAVTTTAAATITTSTALRQWDLSGGSGVVNEPVTSNNQRASVTCDKRNAVQLPTVSLPPAPVLALARLATGDMCATTLTQALDKLNVSYNAALIHEYFQQQESSNNSNKAARVFENLKDFVLHAAKQHGNQRKLRQLIELATQQQVQVQFQVANIGIDEPLVPVKVADILTQWSRNKDLSVLRTLDKRFHEANVLGKIANIVRQAQQRNASSPGSSTRRPLPEFILIPQYYPCGELILRRKC